MKNVVFAATLLFAAFAMSACSSSNNEQAHLATIDSLRTANSSLSAKVVSLEKQLAWSDTCKCEFATHQQRVDKIVELLAEHMGSSKKLDPFSSKYGITNGDVINVFRLFTEKDRNGSLKNLDSRGDFWCELPDGESLLATRHDNVDGFGYSVTHFKNSKALWRVWTE